MGIGYLKIKVTTGDGAQPVKDARITINGMNGIVYRTVTDENGDTAKFNLPAPDVRLTLDPTYQKPAYSTCDVEVEAEGFIREHIHGVEIVDTQTSILPVNMEPLANEPNPVTDIDVDIPPVGLLLHPEYRKVDPPESRILNQVVIPDYITVHLGIPTNSAARNVRVKFIDYVKNVTSSEIYSTWPYNSLVANIHCIVTFALNRVFT